MLYSRLLAACLTAATCAAVAPNSAEQLPLLQNARSPRSVSVALFAELEELARIVDISYCVGGTSLGVNKPFKCLSRCSEFPDFELVNTWNTGPLLSDSCGFIALDHGKRRVLVAFRGTYSITNTIVDLSTVPQEYAPYPGGSDDEEKPPIEEASWLKREVISEEKKTKCYNCTVHMGFHSSWLHTRERMLDDLQKALHTYPDYRLNLVGHSLGGAVAALAGLDFQARGWNPIITTFGEPRIGNKALAAFLDETFDSGSASSVDQNDTQSQYRRVTHVDDPVPLLPLTEWGYSMHAGEVYISKSSLSPDIQDLEHCNGDNDQNCIAGQDSTTHYDSDGTRNRKRDLIASVEDEIHDVVNEPWGGTLGIPARYKLWNLLFAHRDYFWRLGLCVPGETPLRGEEKFGRTG